MNAEPDILFGRHGAAGLVTLNRVQALNAVSHEMVRVLAAQLAEWEDDPAVTRVVVTARGGRAFSAGGDLRGLYDLGRAGRPDEALAFFRDEYRLDARIKHYRKPYVALIDGIVMGGGAGISVNGSHRVAGDNFAFAMPEVGIGFFPDVGATWFLTRMPGELGTYCALTGERLGAADAVLAGIVTHRVATSRLGDLAQALCSNVPVDAVLSAFAEPAASPPLASRRPAIDRWFAADRVEDILAALDHAGRGSDGEAEFARHCAATLRRKSPLSLKIALRQIRLGKACDFDQCMRLEFRIVSRILRGHDFYEGIRAVIVDKDQAPRWQPATLEAIDDREVERYFAPIEHELPLP
jgi:enoyl-CoA hydratase